MPRGDGEDVVPQLFPLVVVGVVGGEVQDAAALGVSDPGGDVDDPAPQRRAAGHCVGGVDAG